jgi:hypothetical protein
MPVDRARQVAGEYRSALQHVAPDAAAVIDTAAVYAGENWVVDEVAIESGEDWIDVARAARLTGRSKRWVYDWARKNPDRVLGSPVRVRVEDIQAEVAHQRARRAGRE